MINAYETAVDMGAKDDAERAMTRAKLYAPPQVLAPPRRPGEGGQRRPAQMAKPATTSAATGGFDLSKAQSLMAAIAAENARLGLES